MGLRNAVFRAIRRAKARGRCARRVIFRIIIPFVQFPLETVREVAQILQNQGLGEITLETQGAKLTLKRPPFAAPAAPLAADEIADAAAQESLDSLHTVAEIAAPISVTSPAVGVFREAKKPLQIGDEVAAKAILGAVETLNIPTELRALQAAKVLEILAIEGQRVEWGQPLLVLEPIETPTP